MGETQSSSTPAFPGFSPGKPTGVRASPIRVGVNWTRAVHLPLIRSMVRKGQADFVEVLIDNFLHVEPEDMAAALDGAPVAFHIMHSRFLERTEVQLASMASRIRTMARELRPLYISDHLLRFTVDGREVPFLPELDYGRGYDLACRRVTSWQEQLGAPVLFENYPSIFDSGLEQPAFLERLFRETGAGLLFDVSNAVCAHRNCQLPLDAWDTLLESATHGSHLHVGGYEPSSEAPFVSLDLHGSALADDTLDYLERVFLRLRAPATISVERDNHIDLEPWSTDIVAVRTRWERAAHGQG
ncbi:DUF692 family protein [Pendulispora rubella]|uniref:DUF692 family protein n=1 Tax=Pendulispora rubella TaxID=2741070 RepID=A0ABZ2L1K3_9BACT